MYLNRPSITYGLEIHINFVIFNCYKNNKQ
jgi:hypothetical protein